MSSLATERGEIRNPRFARRARTFAGLRCDGEITPTDIDCSVDFQDKTFIFTEGKTCGALVPKGQRRHLVALVRGLRAGGCKAFAVVIEYPRGDDEVDFASCLVVEWFYGDRWMGAPEAQTLAEFYDWVRAI